MAKIKTQIENKDIYIKKIKKNNDVASSSCDTNCGTNSALNRPQFWTKVIYAPQLNRNIIKVKLMLLHN